jgi:hypothetical protein
LLIISIQDAFANVKLGNGIGLSEAQGLDDYASPSACVLLRAKDEKDDWRRIPAEALNLCNSSLSFFDAEGMRFHLPAYLIADLLGTYGFGMAFCLTHLDDDGIRKFAMLSKPQRCAIRAYLLHIAEEDDTQFYRPQILRALDEYWTESN